MITKDILSRSFWALPKHEVLDILETSFDGLVEEDAKERQGIFGKNILLKRTRTAALQIFLRQFESPLIFLLLIAVAITGFLQDYKDAVFIGLAVAINVALGFYQENKAESVIAHIQSYVREKAKVFRNNQELEIDAEELTPGDIVHVTQGDRVPADCRLIYINDLMVDESILTGESLPSVKTTEPSSFKAVLGDQRSMIFKGTSVVQGFANVVVCRTGLNTELGKIASLVAAAEKEKTPLQLAISRFALKASIFLIFLTTVIFFTGIALGKSMLEMFLTSVAIAVAAVPEGLPVAMTVILAIGVQRLAERRGVVRKLLAAETLGSTSIILTDKTGTLTEAKMSLSLVECFASTCDRDDLLKFALLNSDVVIENPREHPENWRIIGRPLEAAMVSSAAGYGVLLPKLRKENKIIDSLPFNSSNKFSASLLEHADYHLLTMFGAPEILLKFSDLPAEEKKRINHEINKLATSGERVLAIATKRFTPESEIFLRDKKTYNDINFLGIVAFRDPVRPHVRDVIERVKEAGVKVVIVTGDHQGTAEAVAREVGLAARPDEIINGAELDALTEDELKMKLPILKIVSRVSPEGKVRIAKGYKALGETVAMTGDGLNDAASLKEADIGIAMGSGADVAKDVSDLVLLDNDFSTIVTAIEEGRRILENIRKVIVYLMSSIFDELILIGAALAFGVALPLNALQILFINFVTDSFPAMGLAFEDHIDYLMTKRRKASLNLFDKEMRLLTLTIGIPTSLMLFVIYWGLLKYGLDPAEVKTFIFAAFGTYSLFLIFSVRSLRKPIFTYNPFSNFYLLGAVFFSAGFIVASIYWIPLQQLLGNVALSPLWLVGVAGVGLINIIAVETGKFFIRKKANL
ncbi:MAG: hypothetical protein A3I24_02395 [Candidatus Harrisonbacteria bacterium RIFCSPLOWO2_02_FULL_41_13b]|uniref:Cation-transporting P-type ATPase N-terminal domain-containing protein n=1 Tax=Candidatus Harrisonbacteria bacterium RIFCSPLOWO2_02_FULL_41_13b TaxID=1798409 RepID=A0A1G1ZU55_9BACT|nr:MAG: hypothetical protein A3J53_02550 [Candidatus Harrisonbacteria bacterium RIFCSPHIGHO2_02_FULL_40_20]OGY68102.1 MAG: hypothetical protein A3I24_02395 [Candidatus Harrisonbacteria bacterium RIFCSPLOWO2_02_FULL_41_13b]